MKRLILCLLVVLPLHAGYTTCRKISFDHTKVGATNSSNFPALFTANPADTLNGTINNSVTTITVTNGKFIATGDYIQIDSEIMLVTAGGLTTSLTVTRAQKSTSAASHTTGANIADLFLGTTANAGLATSASGFDIVFFSDACITKIPFEQVFYDATGLTSEFWVKVGTLSHTTDSVVYIGAGNAAVTTDQSNATGTWPAQYAAVYHMQTDGTGAGAITDSTANNNATLATNAGGKPFATPVAVNNGLAAIMTSTSGYVNTGSMSNIFNNSTAQITVSAWVNAPDTVTLNNQLIGNTANTGFLFNLILNAAGTFEYYVCSTLTCANFFEVSGTGIAPGQYYLVAGMDLATHGNSFWSVNGTTQTTTPLQGGTPPTVLSSGIIGSQTIGEAPGGTAARFPGYYDEFRFQTVIPSADWVTAEFNNMNSPSTFYSITLAPGFVPQIGAFLVF